MGPHVELTRQILVKHDGCNDIVAGMTGRFLIELDEHSFERLQELARLQRRSLKDQAAVLLEASLDKRADRSALLEFVGAGAPGAA